MVRPIPAPWPAKVILAGLLVREAFSFWTGHPFDFELWVRLGYGVVHGANPYGILPPVPGLSFADPYSALATPTISYLPFWPLLTAGLYLLYSLIGFGDRFALYFLLKQPSIVGDVLLGYLIYRFVLPYSERSARWALRLWMFLPFTIVISGVWGMFDSLAMAMVLLSLGTARTLRRGAWAAAGVFVKSIPLIFVLPLVPLDRKRWPATLLAFISPAVLSVAVIFAFGWGTSAIGGTLTNVTERVGESMSAWDLPFFISTLGVHTEQWLPFLYDLGILWIPAVLVATLVALRRFGSSDAYAAVQSLLLAALAFMVFRAQVNEQYAIYLFALMLLDVGIWHPERKRTLYLTLITATVFLVINNNFFVRFLAPVLPSATATDVWLSVQLGLYRYSAKLALGVVFTILNLKYGLMVLRGARRVPSRAEPDPAAGQRPAANEPSAAQLRS